MDPVKREITVHCLAQTRTNRGELQRWLDEVGALEFSKELPYTSFELSEMNDGREAEREVKYNTSSALTDAELLIGVGGKRCYNSFEVGLNPNVTKIRSDWAEYLDNILKSGHGSVLEHATWTWAIEGCTRVFTAEANRHRAGVAISEASMRYIRLDPTRGVPYWEPMLIRDKLDEHLPDCAQINVEEGPCTCQLRSKKEQTRQVFERSFAFASEQYAELNRIWSDELDPKQGANFHFKKQLTSMFRRTIPIGVSTGAVYTLNCRALRHIMTMRCSPGAEEEIAYAFGMIAKRMVEEEAKLFGDFVEENGFWRPKYNKV